MFIAQKLRKQNITGYVLYMFQVEDVVRAYGMDERRIANEYLTRFQYDEKQRCEAAEWYGAIARMMREEGVEKSGHVQVVRATMSLLADRHNELLRDTKQPFYSATYYKALPFIVELRSRGAGKEKDELENCLEAVYGVTLLKMQGREVTAETMTALQPIVHLLEMLSKLYNDETMND